MRYKAMKRAYGVVTVANLIYPKIIKEEDFIFPKLSLLVWLDYTIKFHPYSQVGLLKNANKPDMFLADRLVSPIGKVKRNSVAIGTLHNLYKKEDRNIHYISITKSLMTSPTKLLIDNVSLVNELYRYGSSKAVTYEQSMNKLGVAIDAINDKTLGIGRHRYLTIELPEHFPSYKELEKWKTLSPNALTSKIEDPRTFLLLEVYKLLDDKLTKQSMFNKVERLELVDFIFTYKGKFFLIGGLDFRAILGDEKRLSVIKGFKGSKARKVFMVTMLRLMIEDPLETAMLQNKVKPAKSKSNFSIDNFDVEHMLDTLEADKPDPTVYVEESELINVEAPDLSSVLKKKASLEGSTTDNLTLAFNKGELTKAQYDKQIARLSEQTAILKSLEVGEEEATLDGSEVVPDSKLVPDKYMLSDKTGAIRRTYISKSHKKNVLRSIYGVQGSGHVITNIETLKEVDVLGSVDVYKVTIGTADKVPTTLVIRIPTLQKDGQFKNSGNDYLMRGQRTDTPIKKKSPTEVLLNSNYGKLTIVRDKYSKNNISLAYAKQIRANENVSNLIEADVFKNIKKLPIEYTRLSKVVREFKFKTAKFIFSYDHRKGLLNKDDKLATVEKNGILIGKLGKNYLILKDGELTSVGTTVVKLGTLDDYLEIDQSKLTPQVATIQVYTTVIPVVLMLMHKYTFSQLLKITNVNYTRVPFKNGIRIAPTEYKITFSDFVYIFDKTDRQNTLLFSGLAGIKELKGMPVKNVDNMHGLVNVGNLIGLDRSIITEIKNLFNMFLGPLTVATLKVMKEPETLEGLMFRSCELLLTDYSPKATDLSFQQILGDNRIAGLVYKQMTMAIRNYESKKTTSRSKISMNPYEIIQTIVSDSSTVLVDDLNPIALLKQTEDVTYTGFGGRNKDTLTRETREVHPNDIGVISEAVKDSTDVGVSAYMSADPLLDGTTGLMIDDGRVLTKANIFSPTTLLFPYNELDDPKRTNFTSVQSGHTTPLNEQMVFPVRSPYASVLGHRLPDKYVVTADDAGKVMAKTDTSITVKFKSGEKETYKLNNWFSKEIGGVTYLHKVTTGLVKGSNVKVGDVITYDSKFFGLDMFDRSKVIYKSGVIIRTVFIEDSDTYEDSIAIDRNITKYLAVDTTHVRTLTVSVDYNINRVKKIGEEVSNLDTLMTMSNVIGDEIDAGKDLMVSEDTLEILADLNDNSPKAKYSGTIVTIRALYNCELKEMKSGLRKLVNECNIRLSDEAGQPMLGKVPHGYSINGKPLEHGEVMFKFYIEDTSVAGGGDKFVFGNQLKGTVSTIFEHMYTEEGRVVEAEFSTKSEAARIVNSTDLVGVETTILRETSLIAGNME